MAALRDPGPIEFDGVILRNTEVANSSAFVAFPFDVRELYGVGGRVPVNATFDGVLYRGPLTKMGGGEHLLLVLGEIRKAIGKDRGDTVRVRIELDQAPRVVELALDVEAALRAAGAFEAFRAMSFSHRRQHALWIEDAKRPETRARRIQTTATETLSGRPSR
ncbi:MAG TPA: YdeI/OmpD-associated family protein [Gryllotalpicola sp.]